jgi:hypothetical protein
MKNRANKSTTIPGFINENSQKNLGRVEPKQAGTDNEQYAYVMNCTKCGCIYGSNGSDIFQRKCPNCQGGNKGPKLLTSYITLAHPPAGQQNKEQNHDR